MITNTQDSDELFFARLQLLLADRYPGFQLDIPTAGSRLGGPMPDFVVVNPRTGVALAGELKVGYQAQHLPLSTLPRLRALREGFRSTRGKRANLVFITTGSIPEMVKKGLTQDGIAFLQVNSPEEAAERLNDPLQKLE